MGLLTTRTVLVELEITSKIQLCFRSRPRKAEQPNEVMPWLASGSDAMTNDPCPSAIKSETRNLALYVYADDLAY